MYLRKQAETMRADKGVFLAARWAIRRIWYCQRYAKQGSEAAIDDLRDWLKEHANEIWRLSGWKKRAKADDSKLPETCMYCGQKRDGAHQCERDLELPACGHCIDRYLLETGLIFENPEHPIVFSERSISDIITGRKTVTRRVYKGKRGAHVGFTNGKAVIENMIGSKFLVNCPFGKIGDLLWVRQNWTRPDGTKGSARYMPKANAQLWLRIRGIEILVLGSMTEQDAIAEGYDTLEEYKAEWNRINAKRGYPWQDDLPVWVLTFKIDASHCKKVRKQSEIR